MSGCQHVLTAVHYSQIDLEKLRDYGACVECGFHGKNLWLCLYKDCRQILCGDSQFDHSNYHFTGFRTHCIHLNLSTLRLWCYLCNTEVFLYSANSQGTSSGVGRTWQDDRDSSDSEDTFLETKKPKGLQNIGNTCYMNAALQALCNISPLCQYFLQCFVVTSALEKKPCLSKNLQRLIQDMWHRNGSGYIVPSGILYGIRNVHPMFRGYQQHDTQEFLRCFMDQLHEELKEPILESLATRLPSAVQDQVLADDSDDAMDDILEEAAVGGSDGERGDIEGGASSGSQSEAEYETCDSGVSERSSLSDEGERTSVKRKHSRSSSPRVRCKLTPRAMPSFTSSNPVSPVKSKKRSTKYKSIISDLFDGKLLSSVQCLTCNKVSTRMETFQDLSLPIPSRDHVTMLHQSTMAPQGVSTCSDVYKGRPGWVSWLWEWMKSWFWGPTVSLHDCLAAFFSADELKGDNMYSCEKCCKLRNGVKYSKVLELPEVLCIHLKRFRHELAFSSKINNFVSFPLTSLDMTPYLHRDCKSEVTTYDLSSVICHHGTAGGGHYTCYALSPFTSHWYELDDQCVTQVSPESVTDVECYVLFYKKTSDKLRKVRCDVSELIAQNTPQPSLMEFYISKQWVNKLNTFAEPGPIDNSDFLCVHGGVHPSKVSVVDKLSMAVSETVWQYFYSTFGGGPACSRLYVCGACQQEEETLHSRTQYELKNYKTLHHEFQQDESPPVIYALSMHWFRQWQAFVQGNHSEPPGPIDNTPITSVIGGVRSLRLGSDYGQLSEELWAFFKEVYGGGPELVLKHGPQLQRSNRSSFSSGVSSAERDMGSGECAGTGTRAGRSQSTSSDNIPVSTLSVASVKPTPTSTHRKHQSLGNFSVERTSRPDRPDQSDETVKKTAKQRQESKETEKGDENSYCPAFTPDELDPYVPLKRTQSARVSDHGTL